MLVLDHGRVAEFDTPAKLLADETSAFYALAKRSGDLDKIRALADVGARGDAAAAH